MATTPASTDHEQAAFEGNRRKVSAHLTQNEALIFEKSSPGKKGYKLPPLDVPEADAAALLGDAARDHVGEMPELSEIEIIRHFTRLSTWNYAIDLGMYPLGSCTMKYNPRVNEFVSRLEGIAEAHPYQPESLSQGALQILSLLQDCLIEITGMDAITLQPAAGAHGEFTGILLVRAYHQSRGNPAQDHHHSRLSARHQSRHRSQLRLPGRESSLQFARHGRRIATRADGHRRHCRVDAHEPQHHRRLRERDPQDRRHPACKGRVCSTWTALT